MAQQHFNIENKNEYLLITLAPYHCIDEMKSQIAEIQNIIKESRHCRILIDATATKERIPVFDLFDICLYTVEKLSPCNPKIAVLVAPEAAYDDRFGENVVRNRGLDLVRFVNSVSEALDWLNS